MAKIIMMVGLPASGKSYYANIISKKENAEIISSDKMREKLYNDINNQKHNTELFQIIYKEIIKKLKYNKNVILDATNISCKKRKYFLQHILKGINCYKECYLIVTPYEKCLKQNSQRERKVPIFTIDKMYKSISIPQYYEGWNEINIIKNFNKKDYDLANLFFDNANGLVKINQHNPYHTLTIGNHCLKCYDNIVKYENEEIYENIDMTLLKIASLCHDIGKKFTKQFKDAKGNKTNIAHYYGHEKVSAYMSLIYLNNINIDKVLLDIANLIQLHMRIYNIKTEKSKNKLIKLVGNDTYNKLLILNKADKEAK